MSLFQTKRWYDFPLPVLSIPIILFLCAERTLTAHDPANFFLAVKYGISVLVAERPHAPGYPILVLLWRAAAFILHVNPHTAMIVMNGVFMLIAGTATFFLAKRLYDPLTGFIACALLVSNPVFLYYGCVAETYTYDAAFSAMVMLSALALGKKNLPWLWLLVGVAGGFRLSSVILLFPVIIFVLYLRRDVKIFTRGLLAACAVAFIAGAALWAIPLAVNEGGIGKFAEIIRVANYSTDTFLQHTSTLAAILFWMVNIAAVVVVLRFRDLISSLRNKNTGSWLLCVWIAVPLLYFIIAVYNKGYALIFLPAFVIAIAHALYKMQKKKLRYAFISGVISCNLGIFFFAPFIPPAVDAAYSHANRTMNARIQAALLRGTSFYLPSLSHVRASERAIQEGINLINGAYDTNAIYLLDPSVSVWMFPRSLQADFPALHFAMPPAVDSTVVSMFYGDTIDRHYP